MTIIPTHNLSLFADDLPTASSKAELLHIPDADIRLYRNAFGQTEADLLLNELAETIDWQQQKIKFFGKLIDLPRLTAWYGDTGKTYIYSGIRTDPKPWTPLLSKIRRRVEDVCGSTFNSVLLNYYRDGKDSVSWHADDEPELGMAPVIGSVSFGATRAFHFKHRWNNKLGAKIDLTHGSLLLMAGLTQKNWLHQIPKISKFIGPRINLTFRTILP